VRKKKGSRDDESLSQGASRQKQTVATKKNGVNDGIKVQQLWTSSVLT
jgi:hypothetical protein